MPCQRPLDIEGQKVACRTCDYCVARRVRAWCVRAMMEKACFPHSFVVALSYSEDTEHSRRSARMFDYQDVSDFIKRLRRRIAHHNDGKTGALSFIAAGEQGDRFQRCHWHLVIFSEVDLCTVGEWRAPWGVVTERDRIISPKLSDPWRCTWDVWAVDGVPLGFVTVQEPDYGGMRYAMSYALKDQFNVRNSAGTARQGRAEVFGTGYLAMSKRPPIGARFIDRYVDQCEAGGYVPPSRKLMVPGVTHPWWPTGQLADRLLAGLARVNRGIVERTGANAPGWSTLLYEARQSDADLETLGVFDGEDDETEVGDEARQAAANARDNSETARRRQVRRACGSTEACSLCLRGRRDLAALGITEDAAGFRREDETASDPYHVFAKRQRDGARKAPHPLCGLYSDPAATASDFRYIFPASAAAEGGFAKGARAGKGM